MADTSTTKQNNNPNASLAQSPLLKGRRKIYWNPVDLSVNENVLAAVEQTMLVHFLNRSEMQYLKDYEKGDQPIFYRVKDIRPEINVKTAANYAALITNFKIGYEFASPIMFVQRAADDFTKADVKQDDKRVASLNEMLWAAYTPDWVYEIVEDEIISKKPNVIGKIPIIEYKNDMNRMACFEAVIPLMDALNITNSDRVNDVAQYVQAILWLHNCAIDKDQKDELRNGGFIQTTTTADGKEAKVTYVTSALNQQETQALVDYMYDQMLEIAGVPGRDSASGGNTGAAILLSNGWQLAETMAKTAEPVFASSEMELLSIIISIFKNTPDIPEELKELKKSDVIVKFSRNKTYDLVSRTSALANLINIGIDPGKAIATVDIFDDAQQTTIDSLEMINKILLGKISKNDETKVQSGDGNVVDGVKGADDVNAEQNRENTSAV